MNKEIQFEFLDLNKYIQKERANRFAAAKAKKEYTELFMNEFINDKKFIDYPIHLSFTWLMKNKRKDPDNIAFQKKFILDGMIKAELLPNDNINYIYSFSDNFEIVGYEGVVIKSTTVK